MCAPGMAGTALRCWLTSESTKTLATRSRATRDRSASVSLWTRTRTGWCRVSLGNANHGATRESRLIPVGLHLFGDSHGFFNECFNDLVLGDGLDDLAPDEDLALAVAGCDAKVGL